MDGQRFDEITRALVVGTSRRTVLRRLGAGIAGIGLAVVGRGLTAAPNECAVLCADQPGARGAQCRQTCKRCGGGPAATCFDDSTASFTCVDILSDPNNCGACANACQGAPICANGVCGACNNPGTCAVGFPSCGMDPNCACLETSSGTGFCFTRGNAGCRNACPNGQSDCQPGELCFVNTCCGGPTCIALSGVCGASTSGIQSGAAESADGTGS
jgi:hypothetical protein